MQQPESLELRVRYMGLNRNQRGRCPMVEKLLGLLYLKITHIVENNIVYLLAIF